MVNQSNRWTSRRFAIVMTILIASMCQLSNGSIDQNGYIMILGLIIVPYLGMGTYQNVQARKLDSHEAGLIAKTSSDQQRGSSNELN